MNRLTVNHISYLSQICEFCDVQMDEIEWYPQVEIDNNLFTFSKDTLGQDYLKLLSYLLLDLKEEPMVDSKVAKEFDLTTGVSEVDSESEGDLVSEQQNSTTNYMKVLGWCAREQSRYSLEHRILSKHILGQDDLGDEVVGAYVVHLPQVKRELKRNENLIEHTMVEIFGLTKGEQFTLHYRTLKEIEEQEQARLTEVERLKVAEEYESPIEDELLSDSVDLN